MEAARGFAGQEKQPHMPWAPPRDLTLQTPYLPLCLPLSSLLFLNGHTLKPSSVMHLILSSAPLFILLIRPNACALGNQLHE